MKSLTLPTQSTDVNQLAGLPRAALTSATLAGVAVGTLFVASPLTILIVIALVGLFAWAGLGLTERERRWVWGILVVAVALRLLALAALFLWTDHHNAVSFFWDGDGVYLKRRSVWIRNVWLNVPIAPSDFSGAFDRFYGWTTYLYVLAYLQYWLGPAPFAIHLFNVAVFLASAIALHRLARSAYGPAPAMLGLGLLLFLPTPFFWSVSALKESLYLFIAVLGLVAVVAVVRASGILKRAFALLLLYASLSTINSVRGGGLIIETAGLGAGIFGTVIIRRVWLVLLIVVLLPFAGRWVLNNAGVQARIMAQLKTSAVLHRGNVRTQGHGYKLLDQRFYTQSNSQVYIEESH